VEQQPAPRDGAVGWLTGTAEGHGANLTTMAQAPRPSSTGRTPGPAVRSRAAAGVRPRIAPVLRRAGNLLQFSVCPPQWEATRGPRLPHHAGRAVFASPPATESPWPPESKGGGDRFA